MASAARIASRSRALALLAWLLCAMLGPGPALPALHFALVAHRVCLEHGALEHIDADASVSPAEGASTAAPATAQVAAGAGKSVTPARPGTDEHGHEACGVGGVGGTVAVLPAGGVPVASHHWQPPVAPSGVEQAHQGIALLSYAPKLAPPAST